MRTAAPLWTAAASAAWVFVAVAPIDWPHPQQWFSAVCWASAVVMGLFSIIQAIQER
jgi:hypothetical protein